MTDWLTDTLLATSLLMALVLLVREPVRRLFGPSVAYGLWLIPVLRLMLPTLTQTIERSVPVEDDAGTSLAIAPVGEPGLVQPLGGWETLAVSAWLAGALAMLAFGFLAYRRQRREVLRGSSVELDRLGSIRVISSTAVRGPMAFGVVDRVIALPVDFDQRFDPEERRLAFAHELAHHRSGDLAVNHAAFVLLCLQWFNPLAWLSHAAFRFDQEAACDARVLNEASGPHRAAYAQAITKAATGRALLFAGALDRPGTLRRRIRSMLTRTSNRRRLAGQTLIAVTASAALPLTASWATRYIDVPATPSAMPLATPVPQPSAAALTPAMAQPAAAPAGTIRENADGSVTLAGGVVLGKGSTAFFANDDVLINGKVKTLEQLTPSERTKLRSVILKSQVRLARDRSRLPEEVAKLRRESDHARNGGLKRELMQEREDLRRDLAEIDAEAASRRAEGEDPEKQKAEILRDLRRAEATDIDQEVREAIADADPAKHIAELEAEEQQMARMLARLDQLNRQ